MYSCHRARAVFTTQIPEGKLAQSLAAPLIENSARSKMYLNVSFRSMYNKVNSNCWLGIERVMLLILLFLPLCTLYPRHVSCWFGFCCVFYFSFPPLLNYSCAFKAEIHVALKSHHGLGSRSTPKREKERERRDGRESLSRSSEQLLLINSSPGGPFSWLRVTVNDETVCTEKLSPLTAEKCQLCRHVKEKLVSLCLSGIIWGFSALTGCADSRIQPEEGRHWLKYLFIFSKLQSRRIENNWQGFFLQCKCKCVKCIQFSTQPTLLQTAQPSGRAFS